MNLDTMFWLANSAALIGWLALIIGQPGAPRPIAIARATAILLALLYLALFLTNAASLGALARDYSLDGIGAVFASPEIRLLGWVHYLAFDIWVGSWQAEEAGRGQVPRAALIPCLVLTWALGPLGLLAFMLARRFFGAPAVQH